MPFTPETRAAMQSAIDSVYASLFRLQKVVLEAMAVPPGRTAHLVVAREYDGDIDVRSSRVDLHAPPSAHVALALVQPERDLRAAFAALVDLVDVHVPMVASAFTIQLSLSTDTPKWMLRERNGSSGYTSIKAQRSQDLPSLATAELLTFLERLSWSRPGPLLHVASRKGQSSQKVWAAGVLDAALFWLATQRRDLPMRRTSLQRSGVCVRVECDSADLVLEAERHGLPA